MKKKYINPIVDVMEAELEDGIMLEMSIPTDIDAGDFTVLGREVGNEELWGYEYDYDE